jgi:hypothetical protein
MNNDSDYERLKKLYRQVAFYDVLSGIGMPDLLQPVDYQLTSAVEQRLREFCLASGRDLEELNAFLNEVGCDIANAVPK